MNSWKNMLQLSKRKVFVYFSFFTLQGFASKSNRKKRETFFPFSFMNVNIIAAQLEAIPVKIMN
jgi:hypothetical protein